MSEDELARPAFFPADEVPRAVEWDIARARSSIEIYCPFLSRGPVHRWAATLARRAADGVRITIHTRSAEEQSDPKAVQSCQRCIAELQAAGCVVDFRERMHEKVLILDDAVLWHGSLNLLANAGPTDLMMRFTDPTSCKRVGHVMERARKERPAWKPTAKPDRSPAPGHDIRPGMVVDGRLHLNVGYQERHEAKRLLRAEWDGHLWHVDATRVSREQAARWLP